MNEPGRCHDPARCAHAQGGADMPAPSCLSPHWTLGTNKHRLLGCQGGAEGSWAHGPARALQHEQPGRCGHRECQVDGCKRQAGSWAESGTSLVKLHLHAKDSLKRFLGLDSFCLLDDPKSTEKTEISSVGGDPVERKYKPESRMLSADWEATSQPGLVAALAPGT